MNENKEIAHPYKNTETIFGRILSPGEVLQEGDMYDSSNKQWKPVPKAFINRTIEKRLGMLLVRPATPQPSA